MSKKLARCTKFIFLVSLVLSHFVGNKNEGFADTAASSTFIYPYDNYNKGKMDPQLTGWPLTEEEKTYIAIPNYKRRPGAEVKKFNPSMMPVTPSADSFGGPTAYMDAHAKILDRVSKYKADKGNDVDILLMGDSITAQWCNMAAYNAYPQPFNTAWTKAFPNYTALNTGIGGDKSQGLLWRLDHGGNILGELKPKLIIMAIGHNNMFFTPDTGIPAAAEGIKYCVLNVRHKYPEAEVLVVKILPNKDPSAKFYVDAKAINATLDGFKLDSDPKVHIMPDMWADWTTADGKLIDGLLRDGVHPSQDKGYALYAEKLKPIVDKILAMKK